MSINIRNRIDVKTLANNVLKCIDDYKYLGSHVSNSEKDFNTRKCMAWAACNKLDKIWRSDLHCIVKIKIFEPLYFYSTALRLGLFHLENNAG